MVFVLATRRSLHFGRERYYFGVALTASYCHRLYHRVAIKVAHVSQPTDFVVANVTHTSSHKQRAGQMQRLGEISQNYRTQFTAIPSQPPGSNYSGCFLQGIFSTNIWAVWVQNICRKYSSKILLGKDGKRLTVQKYFFSF